MKEFLKDIVDGLDSGAITRQALVGAERILPGIALEGFRPTRLQDNIIGGTSHINGWRIYTDRGFNFFFLVESPLWLIEEQKLGEHDIEDWGDSVDRITAQMMNDADDQIDPVLGIFSRGNTATENNKFDVAHIFLARTEHALSMYHAWEDDLDATDITSSAYALLSFLTDTPAIPAIDMSEANGRREMKQLSSLSHFERAHIPDACIDILADLSKSMPALNKTKKGA